MFEDRNESQYEPVVDNTEIIDEPVIEKECVSEEKKEKKAKKGHKIWKNALGGVVFGLCAGVVFLGIAYVGEKTFLKYKNSREVILETTKPVEGNQVTVSDESEVTSTNAISQIAQNCMPSVVAITTRNIDEIRSFWGTQQYESEGAGSGIIVGKSDTELLIATNNHVVSDASEVSVCFNDSEDAVVTAVVKGSDAANDLAVVSVSLDALSDEILSTIKVAVIGDSSSMKVGDQVIAIGNALGYGQSVTTGIVSALEREVELEDLEAKLIQTDAAINPGNSGGALLNMKGELIGINSAKFASELVEGMGYAIPIATAQPILDNLMNRETRELAGDKAGYLGVSVKDVSEEAAEYYGIPKGAYIDSTEENGAAANAGMHQGDIITKFDGISITNASDLSKMIAYYKKGEEVEVTYMRADNGEYKEQTVTVTLTDSKQVQESQKNTAATEEQENPEVEIPEEESPESGYSGEYDIDDMEEFFRYFFGR